MQGVTSDRYTCAVKIRRLVLLACPLLSLMVATAVAGAESGPGRSVQIAQAERGISLDEAVERAQRAHNARVIRTDVREERGRRIYVLRMLSDDSRVWTVRIDASTGAEL